MLKLGFLKQQYFGHIALHIRFLLECAAGYNEVLYYEVHKWKWNNNGNISIRMAVSWTYPKIIYLTVFQSPGKIVIIS